MDRRLILGGPPANPSEPPANLGVPRALPISHHFAVTSMFLALSKYGLRWGMVGWGKMGTRGRRDVNHWFTSRKPALFVGIFFVNVHTYGVYAAEEIGTCF